MPTQGARLSGSKRVHQGPLSGSKIVGDHRVNGSRADLKHRHDRLRAPGASAVQISNAVGPARGSHSLGV